MSKTISYTEARANFASIWDETVDTREPIHITRRGKEDLAVLPADELAGLLETAHLLRSPANARRLFAALDEARSRRAKPVDLKTLRKELNLEEDE